MEEDWPVCKVGTPVPAKKSNDGPTEETEETVDSVSNVGTSKGGGCHLEITVAVTTATRKVGESKNNQAIVRGILIEGRTLLRVEYPCELIAIHL